jgi:hypothetical protein
METSMLKTLAGKHDRHEEGPQIQGGRRHPDGRVVTRPRCRATMAGNR